MLIIGLYGHSEECAHDVCLVGILLCDLIEYGSVQRAVQHCPSRQTTRLWVSDRTIISSVPAKSDPALIVPHADGISTIAFALIENNVD